MGNNVQFEVTLKKTVNWEMNGNHRTVALLQLDVAGMTVHGVRLLQETSTDRYWVSLPREKGSDGKYYPVVSGNEEFKTKLLDFAIKAYQGDFDEVG